MSPIQAITFDVGGTLIQPWPSVGHVYAEVAARHGIHVSPELLNKNFAAAWKAKSDFSHTRSDWADLVEKTFVGLNEKAQTKIFFEELYDHFASATAWRVFDDVLPTLEMLRKTALRLSIISNWDERLRILLPKLGLEKHFEPIIISCEIGSPKPSATIFESATKKLNLPPTSILHVGDSFEEDVVGAEKAGFKAVWLTRKQIAPPTQFSSISTLLELKKFLN